MPKTTEEEVEAEVVIDLDLIKSETLKALRIAGKAQGDEGDSIDPVFSASFAKQYLDVRYNNKDAKFKTLKGVYMIRGLNYDLKTKLFTLDLIFAPTITSIMDTKITLLVLDGKFVEPEDN
jgi:hypothetical protein